MKLIVCVDNNLGMAFNHRRQSMDRAVRARMLARVGGALLWMTAYSAKQFTEPVENLQVDEDCQRLAGAGEYCFAETAITVAPEQVEELILYRWGRDYPADVHFSLPLEQFHLVEQTQFEGYSHPNITEEIYRK
jgi:hypothetical protein